VPDVTRVPGRWQAGDDVYLLGGRGATLVRFVWENAGRFSLAHDISNGGVVLALREASEWSGLAFETDGPVEAEGVIVATRERPDWADAVHLGTV
jgi:hypothetical protein